MENGACSKIKPNSRIRKYCNETDCGLICDKRGSKATDMLDTRYIAGLLQGGCLIKTMVPIAVKLTFQQWQ